jgi:hypothetical protein
VEKNLLVVLELREMPVSLVRCRRPEVRRAIGESWSRWIWFGRQDRVGIDLRHGGRERERKNKGGYGSDEPSDAMGIHVQTLLKEAAIVGL